MQLRKRIEVFASKFFEGRETLGPAPLCMKPSYYINFSIFIGFMRPYTNRKLNYINRKLNLTEVIAIYSHYVAT